MSVDWGLRYRRLSRGWSQRELAERAGLAQSQVCCAEFGKAPAWVMHKIVRVFRDAVITGRDDRAARERMGRNKALAAEVLSTPGGVALREAMLERAFELIFEEGKPEHADAILEFLPDADVVAAMDRWFPEFASNPVS